MADAPDQEQNSEKPESKEKFEPSVFIFDANTNTPPRIRQSGSLAEAEPQKKPVRKIDRIAHFNVINKIGEGGMGVVYRASDEYLQRLVALKVLGGDDGSSIDEESTQRLLREARAASRINHPNVVTVYAAGEFEGIPFIAMEYVEGQDLGKLISETGIEPARALGLAIQVADGLTAAHEQGIVHRDIKPANVFVCPGDRVKILDFGLAKPERFLSGNRTRSGSVSAKLDGISDSEEALDVFHTQAGVIWGSLRYMAPEQVTGESVDARCDLFALGVVLYEMLTGRLPFYAKKPKEQIFALLRDEAPPLRKYNMRIPSAVQAIVGKALSKNPDLRFSSASEMASALRTALTRISDFADLEFEDFGSGDSHDAPRKVDEPKTVSRDPQQAPAQSEPRYDRSFGPDTVVIYPPGSPFEVGIISKNAYPWKPRGNRMAGVSQGLIGTAVQIWDRVFEVVTVDRQNDQLIRYFLVRWPDQAVLRKVFHYTPTTVGSYTREFGSTGAGRQSARLSGVLSSFFGKKNRD